MSVVIPFNLSNLSSQILRITSLYPCNPAFQNTFSQNGYPVFPPVSSYQRDLAKVSTGFPYSYDVPFSLVDEPGVFSLPKNAYSLVLPSFINGVSPNSQDTYSVVLIDVTIAPLSSGFFNLKIDYLDLNNNLVTEYLTTPFYPVKDVYPLEIESIKDYSEEAIAFLQKEIDVQEKDILSVLNRMLLKGELVTGELFATTSNNTQPQNTLQSHYFFPKEEINKKFQEAKEIEKYVNLAETSSNVYSIISYTKQVFAGDEITLILNNQTIPGDSIYLNGVSLNTTLNGDTLTAAFPLSVNFNYNFNVYVANKGAIKSNAVTIQSFGLPIVNQVSYETGIMGGYGEHVYVSGDNFGNESGTISLGNQNVSINYWTNTLIDFFIPTNSKSGYAQLTTNQGKSVQFQLNITDANSFGKLEIVPNINTVGASGTVSYLAFLNGEQVFPNWTLEDNLGNIGIGSIIHGFINKDGVYQAPSVVGFPFNLAVNANFSNDKAKYLAKSSLTIANVSDTLTIAPSGASLQPSNTLPLFVYDNNVKVDNGKVSFYVNGVLGGNEQYGFVTFDGLYQAPAIIPKNNTIHIQATYNNESAICTLNLNNATTQVLAKAPYPVGQIGGNLNGTYEESTNPVTGDGSLGQYGVQQLNGYGFKYPSSDGYGYTVVSPAELLNHNYPGVTSQNNYMGGILYNYEDTSFLLIENTDGTLTFLYYSAAFQKTNYTQFTTIFGLQGLVTNDTLTAHQLAVETNCAGSSNPGVMTINPSSFSNADGNASAEGLNFQGMPLINEPFVSGNSLKSVPPGADPVIVKDANNHLVVAFRMRLHPKPSAAGTVVAIRYIGDSTVSPDQYIYWALGGPSTTGIYSTEQGGWYGYNADGLAMTLNGQTTPPSPQVTSVDSACPGNSVNVYGKYFSQDIKVYFTDTNQLLPSNGIPSTADGVNYVISVSIPNNISKSPASYPIYASGSTGISNSNVSLVIPNNCVVYPLTLTINPNSATMLINQTQQYTASLQLPNGSIEDVTNSVTWYANSNQGGSVSSGFINSGGLYFAPSSPPSSNPVGITATYNYQGQPLIANASAQVNGVYSGPPPSPPPLTHNGCYMVRVSPETATIQVPGNPQQFNANLYIDNENPQRVNATSWLVNGIPGGNSYFGTIDSTGLYTPPAYYVPQEIQNIKITANYTATTPSGTQVPLSGYAVASLYEQQVTTSTCNIFVTSQINVTFGDGRTGYIPQGATINMAPGQYLLATYNEILDTYFTPVSNSVSQNLPLFLDAVQSYDLPTYLYNEAQLTEISGSGLIEDINNKFSKPYTVVLGVCDINSGKFQSYWDLIPVLQPENNTIPQQPNNCIVSHSLEENFFEAQSPIDELKSKLIDNKKIDIQPILDKNNAMWFGEIEVSENKLIIKKQIKLLKYNKETQKMDFVYESKQNSIDIKNNQILFFNGKNIIVTDIDKKISSLDNFMILGVYLDQFYTSHQFLNVLNTEEKTIIDLDGKNTVFGINGLLMQWGVLDSNDKQVTFKVPFKKSYKIQTSKQINIFNEQLEKFEYDGINDSSITWIAIGS